MQSDPVFPKIAEQIEDGLKASRDPLNADLPDLALRSTTIYSPWYTQPCPECQFKFREGDMVRVCPDCGQAYHSDNQYRLFCWEAHFADGRACKPGGFDRFSCVHIDGCGFRWHGTVAERKSGSDVSSTPFFSMRESFLRGLETVWSPFGGEQVLEVRPGDPMAGLNCPWCRFRIRPGDRVVRCPCGKCGTFFHDDIFRHMRCWDDWNGSKGRDFCPATGDPIQRETGDAGDERPL